ncbi:unnamed protein product [Effrenium voratum]|nr:unnamed protein product [Effrenium voratum]|mmetsp:Transcript_36850/g.87992  ORF Transcript_36850/g.87992 Transcript_36850/m.87992 type:complete len:675 (-) Transcript_36850:74-2098(-)
MANPPLSLESLRSLPEIFRILVVCGATGSGKSRIIEKLVQHYSLTPSNEKIIFDDDMAVCSHPALGEGYLEKLQAVGLNSVPSWLKAEKCLSLGQQQRIRSAIQACSDSRGIVMDDFCCFVDRQCSYSCAASIYRLVRDNGLKFVIIGTSRADLIPYLGADIVIEAGNGQIFKNPLDFAERKMAVKIQHGELKFSFGQGCSGWKGPLDDGPLRKGEDYARTFTTVRFATVATNFTTTVKQTERTSEAAHAFDYTFTGTIAQKVHIIKQNCLPGDWRIGALCGPSGSGKSVNLRKLGIEVSIQWIPDQSVDQQVEHALLDVVLLQLPARRRPFHELSAGEKMQADLARRFAQPCDGKVLADEFTSVLDRQLAARLCASVASFVRENRLQLVVATIQMDVVKHLQADWCFRSDYAELMTFSGTCDRPLPPELPEVEYFRPPLRTFTLTQLGDSKRTKEVFKASFEEHHYLKQGLPLMWGLLVRDEEQIPVGFHAIAWQTGCGAPREARVVILPEYQGMGLGTRLSDCVGKLCAASGFKLMAKTKHPRLGGYRNSRSDLWRPSTMNGKLCKGSLKSSLLDMKARQKQVKGQQQLSFAPAKEKEAKAEKEVEEPRRCFSHMYIGDELPLETPRKRKSRDDVEQPSQEKNKKQRGRPCKKPQDPPRPRGRPRKKAVGEV